MPKQESKVTDQDLKNVLLAEAGESTEPNPAPNPDPSPVPAPEPSTSPSEPSPEPAASPPVTEPAPSAETKAEMDERSRLGRRVSSVEKSVLTMTEKIDKLLGVMEKQTLPPQTEEEIEAQQKKEEAKRILKEVTTEEQNKRAAYETSYIQNVEEMAVELGVDAEDHRKITEMMYSPGSVFNKVITGDPVNDSLVNYTKATQAYLRQKSGKPVQTDPKVPLKNEKPKAPLGVGGAESIPQSNAEEEIKLDEYASRFVAKTKMSKESVKKALSGSPKPGLFKGNIR